jgi:hypothetical protein
MKKLKASSYLEYKTAGNQRLRFSAVAGGDAYMLVPGGCTCCLGCTCCSSCC